MGVQLRSSSQYTHVEPLCRIEKEKLAKMRFSMAPIYSGA